MYSNTNRRNNTINGMARSTAKKYGKKDEVKKLLKLDMLYFESANLLKISES
ncbi:MAG: hypothetical protein ITF99_03135 [Chryseobacterium sp.]|nr:hypothetical protein [Chryseobacterium sp.]